MSQKNAGKADVRLMSRECRVHKKVQKTTRFFCRFMREYVVAMLYIVDQYKYILT